MQKLGISAAVGYPNPIEERMALIKDAGFQVVYLDCEKDIQHTETSLENQMRLAQKYSLEVQSAHMTGVKMTQIWTDCEDAEFVTNRLIDELKELKEVGVPVGVAHITWGFDKPAEPSENALHRFERAAEAAEKYRVKLALENSVFAEHVHYVLGHIKSEYLGFCYDSGHENAFTPSENYLADYKDRLFAMHLHDNIGSYDNHYVPFYPGGTIDWPKKVELLKQTKLFQESIVLEIGYQKESIQDMLKMAYESAVRLAELAVQDD